MQSTVWLPLLSAKISDIESRSKTLSQARAQLLSGAATRIAGFIKKDPANREDAGVGLNFICTHNSRRSHLSQVWAAVAATHYGVGAIQSFSGGTEATACNPRIVRSLRRTGFSVVTTTPQAENPHYLLQFAEQSPPMDLFSKKYGCDANPSTDFFAMMCCSDADEKCPLVRGAVGRVALHYEDPKKSDDTPAEAATYDQRRDEIGAEMFFMMHEVKVNLDR